MEPWMEEQYLLATKLLSRALDEMALEQALEALEERERVLREIGSSPEAMSLGEEAIYALLEGDSAIYQKLLDMRAKLIRELEQLEKMTKWAQGVREICSQGQPRGRLQIAG